MVKFIELDVDLIAEQYSSGKTMEEISILHNVSPCTISNRLHEHKNYKEVKEDNEFTQYKKTYFKQKNKERILRKTKGDSILQDFLNHKTLAIIGKKYGTHKDRIIGVLHLMIGKIGYKRQLRIKKQIKGGEGYERSKVQKRR